MRSAETGKCQACRYFANQPVLGRGGIFVSSVTGNALAETLDRMVAHLCRACRPVAVYLFGSQATGSARADSDIDLAVLLPKEATLPVTERLELVGELEELAERKVDLVILNHAKLPLQFEVIHDGKLLHEADHDARTDAEDLIVRDYLDLKPMYERSYREILEDSQGSQR